MFSYVDGEQGRDFFRNRVLCIRCARYARLRRAGIVDEPYPIRAELASTGFFERRIQLTDVAKRQLDTSLKLIRRPTVTAWIDAFPIQVMVPKLGGAVKHVTVAGLDGRCQ